MDILNSIKNNRIFKIILILYITYNSGFVFSTVNNIGIILDLFFAVFFAFIILVNLPKVYGLKVTYMALITFIFALLTFLLNGDSKGGAYFDIIFKSIVSLGIVLSYDFRKTLKFFVNYMVILSIISLIGYWIIFSGVINLNTITIINKNDAVYEMFFPFFNLIEANRRNIGIFWEPGLFASFLILATVFEVSFLKSSKKSNFRIVLFVITILTTNSTAGLFILVLLFILIVFEKANNSSNMGKVLIYYSLIAFIVLLTLTFNDFLKLIDFYDNPILSKLSREEIFNQSRYLAIKHNFDMFKLKPVFGIGFESASNNIRYVSDTSTSTFLLSVFGIPGMLYTIFFIIYLFKLPNLKINIKVILSIILLLIINKEPHHLILFTWILFYYFANTNNIASEEIVNYDCKN